MKTTFIPFDLDSPDVTLFDASIDCCMVSGPLTRDFGPYCTGEPVLLAFDFIKGTVKVYDGDSGTILLSEHTLQLSVVND